MRWMMVQPPKDLKIKQDALRDLFQRMFDLGVKQIDVARLGDIPTTRISELRRLLKTPWERIERAITWDKIKRIEEGINAAEREQKRSHKFRAGAHVNQA